MAKIRSILQNEKNAMVRGFEALIRKIQNTASTLNEQDPARPKLQQAAKEMEGLRSVLIGALENIERIDV